MIIQKLSSIKHITKEIPKNDKTDFPTNKGEEYSFCESVYRMSKSTKRKYP